MQRFLTLKNQVPPMRIVCATLALLMALPAAAQQNVTLGQAVSEGKVAVKVSASGGSSGDTIELSVQRKGNAALRVAVPAGTVFQCVGGAAQNLAAARVKGETSGGDSYSPATTIELDDNGWHTYVIEAYCMDFHKDNPAPANAYTLGGVDAYAGKIVAAGLALNASLNTIQAALWIGREKIPDAELTRKFEIDGSDLQKAHALLRGLEARTPAAR